MRKCDSCGKVVVNEQDYMCPHCGAVSNKHCDHNTHLPDDKYNRANDYRTTATEHKSKTYDYQKAPKTDVSQKFDINDLANIKNVEDAKQVAKKAFIEQDQNGRKKFKPLAIVLIVIFAVNIFGNLLGALDDGIDTVFDELEYAFEDVGDADYTLGEEELRHNFYVTPIVTGASYVKAEDCLSINCSDIYFEYDKTKNGEFETVADEWNSEFTFPSQQLYTGDVRITLAVFDKKDVENEDLLYDATDREITLYGEITDNGIINVYGLAPSIKHLSGEEKYIYIAGINAISKNESTKEEFDLWFSFPSNFVKMNTDNSVELYDVYVDSDVVVKEKFDLADQYVPDEYVECIEFNDRDTYNDNIFESIPASATYTETVTLVD